VTQHQTAVQVVSTIFIISATAKSKWQQSTTSKKQQFILDKEAAARQLVVRANKILKFRIFQK